MSENKPIPAAPLLGGIGAIMVIVSLFLDWYEDLTGFTVFEALDLVLVGLAVLTIVALVVALTARWPQAAASPARLLAAAIAVLVIVVSQLLNDPPAVAGPAGEPHAVGIWLALGGAVLMLLGALAGVAHVSFALDLGGKGSRARPAGDVADADAPTAVEHPRQEDA
jgi:hypothetical protein